MSWVLAGALLFLSTPVFAKLEERGLTVLNRCSTADVDPLERLLIENELFDVRARRNFVPIAYREQPTVFIPLYVHVLASGLKPAQGNVTPAKLKEQLDYLNAAYAPMNIQFRLQAVHKKIDEAWATFQLGEAAIKKELRQGDARALNLYIAGTTDGVLGWSYFPWEYKSFPHMDGVVIHFQTLPEGHYENYNEGGTLVHEVGHWLGLYHVFQGGCSDGDMVYDTPAQQKPTYGCPQSPPDSCTGQEGVDSIHNFMDYSDDICMEGFTDGQVERVHDNLEAFR